MSLRTFTVFQDAPSTEPPKPKPLSSSRIIRPSASNASNATVHLTTDKENVHPITGERARPGSNGTLKKRKTTVLATKVHLPLATKSLKEFKPKEKLEKDPQPLAKKRKASSVTTKDKNILKDLRAPVSTRKPVKRSSRKVLSLPKLDEEVEAEKEKEKEKEKGHVVQVNIDSKCYELTVKPLADVSGAYEKTSPIEVALADSKVNFGLIKERITEPQIRDYFSPPLTASTTRARSTSVEPPSEARAFSTPERKQIYAAFTFSSPSPISKRFKEVPIPLVAYHPPAIMHDLGDTLPPT
ncbi:hypothetical protein BDQ17DRAFT_1274068 [Cyathus striatus]|nr:hypothetical protein BDQ17DRAFT_1274068 [Cyathus striatus]